MVIIETQDRDCILECERIRVMGNKLYSDGMKLGEYDGNARATEVYYDIKHFIEDGSAYDVMEGKTRIMKNKVFKMPIQ